MQLAIRALEYGVILAFKLIVEKRLNGNLSD